MPLTIQGMATASTDVRRRLVTTAPPEAYFVVSAIFHYLGPAFAVLLFARVDVLGVAWLRIASAAARCGGARGAACATAATCGSCSPGAPCWP